MKSWNLISLSRLGRVQMCIDEEMSELDKILGLMKR